MQLVSRHVVERLSQTRVIFSSGTDVVLEFRLVAGRLPGWPCEGRALFRHCDDELRIGRVPCRHHCSPMRRVSKRLTANVFREPEVWAENSAADAVHTEAARLLQRRNHLVDHYRDLTGDFSADRVQSTNRDRGSGLEVYRPKGSSDRLRLEPASNGLPTNRS